MRKSAEGGEPHGPVGTREEVVPMLDSEDTTVSEK